MFKKLFLLVLVASLSQLCFSQIVTDSDFDNFAGEEIILKNGKIDYVNSALHIAELYGLDKNNAISKTYIVDAPGKTKDQIYVEVNNWFIHSFVNAQSTVDFSDKEQGTIIGKGYLPKVSAHNSVGGSSEVSAWIIIRVDIKDDRFRVITTIQEYDMLVMSPLTVMVSDVPVPTKQIPSECFPFKGNNFKKNCSKAFVNCHIWSRVVINKLSEAVINGITGTEDDW